METANRPYGRILRGHTVPYGAMAGASNELRKAYYYHGVQHDEDWPELPVLEPDDTVVDPIDVVHKEDIARVVNEILEGLLPREAKVLCMRFGIGLPQDYTLEEIGNSFDVTRERIRQIEKKAMRKFMNPQRLTVIKHAIDFPTIYFQRSR